jgi:hypothetical protein
MNSSVIQIPKFAHEPGREMNANFGIITLANLAATHAGIPLAGR